MDDPILLHLDGNLPRQIPTFFSFVILYFSFCDLFVRSLFAFTWGVFFQGRWTNDQLAWKHEKKEDQDLGHARSQSNEWTTPWKHVCSSGPRSCSLVFLLEKTPINRAIIFLSLLQNLLPSLLEQLIYWAHFS